MNERGGFRGRLIHFPVADEERGAHDRGMRDGSQRPLVFSFWEGDEARQLFTFQ